MQNKPTFFYFTPQLVYLLYTFIQIKYSSSLTINDQSTPTINPPNHHYQKPSSPCTIINHHHPTTHWSNKELKRSKPQNPLIKQSFSDDQWWHGESFSKWASKFASMSEIWRRSRHHGKNKGGTACFFDGLLQRSSVVACFGDQWLRVRDQR